MEEKRKYEEQRELPSPWEWVIVMVLSASVAGFGLLLYGLVADGPRFWDFGQLPDTPAEAIYSTEEPEKGGKEHRQLPRLPEAQPENPQKPLNEPLRERGPVR